MELTPDFSISINGQKRFPNERVISIRTTDQAGFVSDSCEIEFDDYDGALQFPRSEAKFEVFLGYKETGVIKIGTYFVKSIGLDGARHTVKITANAVPKSLRSQKTQTNDKKLLEYIDSINSELDSGLSDDYSDLDLSNDPQIGESDINYLTRIANKVGAVAKPVDNHLVFSENMATKSVSGKTLPTKYIDVSEVASYSCDFKETETSGGFNGTVFANYYNKDTGDYVLVHEGSGEPQLELNEIFGSEQQARSAAKSKFKKVSKNNTTFRFSTAGRTDLFAESPLVLKNFYSKIPTKWIISKVEHSLSSSGFVTSVDCVKG